MDDLTVFDVSQYLDSKEAIAEYLNQVLEDGDSNELIVAIGNIAKAKGMTQISQDTSLGRESLYKSFSGDKNPKFDTVVKVINSLSVKFQVAV
jgi:probable addiction module antidote protein